MLFGRVTGSSSSFGQLYSGGVLRSREQQPGLTVEPDADFIELTSQEIVLRQATAAASNPNLHPAVPIGLEAGVDLAIVKLPDDEPRVHVKTTLDSPAPVPPHIPQ